MPASSIEATWHAMFRAKALHAPPPMEHTTVGALLNGLANSTSSVRVEPGATASNSTYPWDTESYRTGKVTLPV